jgi:hypothetical protein
MSINKFAELAGLAGDSPGEPRIRLESTMRLSFACILFAAFAGCGRGVGSHPGTPPDGAPPDGAPPDDALPDDAPPDSPAPETYPLGMNDISMLMPLGVSFPPLAATMDDLETPDGSHVTMVPFALFSRLVTNHHDIMYDYSDYAVLAIRFDLCDRVTPGPCPEGVDGSLRLVFQPFARSHVGPADVGVHAFYTIPPGEIAAAINQLRVIARISKNPQLGALQLPRAFDFQQTGAAMRALLASYAKPERLIRLALMGHDENNPDPRVVFRALEIHGAEIVDLPVATVGALQQDAVLADTDPSYVVTPVADSPQGLALTLSSGAFNAAAPEDQRAALDALVATQNPTLHNNTTVQCIACHVSTYLAVHRGQVASIDIFALSSRFTSERQLGVGDGDAELNPQSLHAFSWRLDRPEISQRVANETAMVLDEIEARFPVPTSAAATAIVQ